MTSLVDSHCHLDILEWDRLGCDLDGVMSAARDNGVSHMLCVCIDLEHHDDVLRVAHRYPNVYASVGVHPNASDVEEPTVERLLALAGDSKVIAIGETGLDYFRSEGDVEWQRQRFRNHIAAARATGKPLIVHSRDAKADTLQVMRDAGADAPGGVMHCFVEDWETAKAAMDLNFYISFSGIVTFRSATELQEVARKVPDDRLLVETDSPYLAPVPFRGKTNQPAYVRHTAEFIAELRGDSPQHIAEVTTENFFRLFAAAA